MTYGTLSTQSLMRMFDPQVERPRALGLHPGIAAQQCSKFPRLTVLDAGSVLHLPDMSAAQLPACGLLYGQLASFGSAREDPSKVRNLLTPVYGTRWRDRLNHLNLLLRESGAESLGCIIYRSGETLLCEIGPANRTMLLGIDAEGTTLTYRPATGEIQDYISRSWDGMPPLPDFMRELNRYRQPRETTWMFKEAPKRGQSHFVHTSTLDEDSGIAQTNLTSSTALMVSAFL